MIGKPYSGKPNVRFDEGELEIELLATTPALYSTVVRKKGKSIFNCQRAKAGSSWLCLFCYWIPNGEVNENVLGWDRASLNSS
jgi:hypothetical protein